MGTNADPWKPVSERIKAPKGTKTVDISWEEFEAMKQDLVVTFTKWDSAENVAMKGSGNIFRLPNRTYATKK